MRPIVVEATLAHMAELKANLREGDAREIENLGSTIEESFATTWRRSLLTKTVIAGDRVVAVYGIGGPAMGEVGQPWMLTTPLFERVPVFMVRQGILEARAWLRIFSRLESYVDAGYRRACGYLELVGYTLDPPQPIETGASVRRFWMER